MIVPMTDNAYNKFICITRKRILSPLVEVVNYQGWAIAPSIDS